MKLTRQEFEALVVLALKGLPKFFKKKNPELTSAIRALPLADLVLDGEIVIFDAQGRPDFHALAARAQLQRTSEVQRAALAQPVTYVVFDLLAAGGHDLRGLPLARRIERMIAIADPAFRETLQHEAASAS